MPTAMKTIRSLAVICPFCDEKDATVRMDLNRLGECFCSNCDTEFTVDEAIARLTKQLTEWQRVAAWIDAAPANID
jgi:hypothetical protein